VKILLSGYLIRYPLGGFCWHHLQYLVGFERLGHEVVYFEDFGWPDSFYNPVENRLGADPSFGIAWFGELLGLGGISPRWCCLGEDGAAYGMSREELAQHCRECDVYFNLSNINWIEELNHCRRRVLIDTDPVFTQIKSHGLGGPFSRYHALFTYGENVHKPNCRMPASEAGWLPTRQPVVMDLWPLSAPNAAGPFTSIMNWSATGEHRFEGRSYGQKDREFEPYFSLPRRCGQTMELAVNAPTPIRLQLVKGGWRVADPRQVTRTPRRYQEYLRSSCAEFSVAKQAYVTTNSGWFSDRSCGYLATGRPVILQDTGFSQFLPCGQGLLAFRTPEQATAAVQRVVEDYKAHCRTARAIAERYFDFRQVLPDLLNRIPL